MNILAEHHIACKYPYLLEHLVASLQGAGSLHLQCCIHLVIQTRLSDIPFKRNSLKSMKKILTKGSYHGGIYQTYRWSCCIVCVYRLILLCEQETCHIHLFAVSDRNKAVATHLRGSLFFIFA